MRDIFYNQTYKIGSSYWMRTLTEGELAEWNWIDANKQTVIKYTNEFGLKEGWYLGRLLYVLSMDGSKWGVTDDEYRTGYGKYEDALAEMHTLEAAVDVKDRMISLYHLLASDGFMQDLGIDRKGVESLLQKYQEVDDNLSNRLDEIINEQPKNYDWKTVVLRRVHFLFGKMTSEGIRMTDQILYIYRLYYKYKFDSIHLIDEGINPDSEHYNYDSTIFKRIKQQRKTALNIFKHRL